ncbi:hypothetical protein L7F22_051053 [Adiantum nelumboides]|nr:hypothetical protein [Adiantum nelumboides]
MVSWCLSAAPRLDEEFCIGEAIIRGACQAEEARSAGIEYKLTRSIIEAKLDKLDLSNNALTKGIPFEPRTDRPLQPDHIIALTPHVAAPSSLMQHPHVALPPPQEEPDLLV